MKKRSLNSFFLAKTALDKNFKRKKKFHLGYFCISANCDLNKFSKRNILQDHWRNKKNILKKYKYVESITNEMFLSLLNYLNKTHNINKNENYWRIIIYPWVCFYVSTIFDRWEIINYLLKNEKKKLFYTYEYNTDKKFDEISNTLDWFYKSQSDEFNDKIFNEIIKFKNTGKIKIIKKNKIFKKKYKK